MSEYKVNVKYLQRLINKRSDRCSMINFERKEVMALSVGSEDLHTRTLAGVFAVIGTEGGATATPFCLLQQEAASGPWATKSHPVKSGTSAPPASGAATSALIIRPKVVSLMLPSTEFAPKN